MKILKRIYILLQADERRKSIKVAATVLLTSLIDFVGLAALLPVLYFLLEETGKRETALIFGGIAITVILIKCLFTTLLTRYQNKCLMSFYKRISFSLFSSHYDKGLLFIRKHGASKLGYEITDMCYAFSHNLLFPLCRMSADVILIILVTVALVVWNGVTVVLLYMAFIPFMILYVYGVKKRVRECGRDDMRVKKEQMRLVSDAMRGYVKLEVNGVFPSLQRTFLEGIDRISDNRVKLDTLLRLPLFLSELSVVVGLVVLVVVGDGDVAMQVGVFAVAALRLLPALRNILASWTQIQNTLCYVDVIEAGLSDDDNGVKEQEQTITFEKEIRVEGISYTYPDGHRVFENMDFSILKGEYVGVCGRSGGGKSTLFNILSTLLKPSEGYVKIDGVPLSDANRASWIKQIAYVPQEVFIFAGTLAENIALGSSDIDRDKINEIICRVGLDTWVKTLEYGINTPLNEMGCELSGGQKQRIGIARALYKEARVLLMDESTSALDDDSEREINRTLYSIKEKDKNLTILSIAHRRSSLEYCDRIITI
ncbi:MAG: ABC transporter ATP-binding protein [Flavobacteriales bacterium]|nr:ABC transporter ATP-binding protein [Flavobacteriales bacterium]